MFDICSSISADVAWMIDYLSERQKVVPLSCAICIGSNLWIISVAKNGMSLSYALNESPNAYTK
jgi:hypothetical protein